MASDGSALSARGDIIRWWESRHSHFNGLVLAVGFASWLLVMITGSAAVKPGEDFEESLGMLFGAIIYVVMANLCDMFGWTVDTVFYNDRPRMRLYRSGIIFANALTPPPRVWAVVAWFITLHTGRKLD